jgi:hypothetical protein
MIGAVRREHLAVETIWGMHYDPTPYQTVIGYERRFLAESPATPQPQPAASQDAAAQNASLSYFLGRWHCDGSFPSSGKTISSTMRFESDLGGAAVLKHHDDVSPASYHAVEAWAYSANEHHFTAAVTDNFGGVREFTSDGWSNDVLTWSSAPPISPAQQFIYTRLTGTSMRVDWQLARDGTHYVVGDTLSCKKRSPLTE